jgi:hypothetical protein
MNTLPQDVLNHLRAHGSAKVRVFGRTLVIGARARDGIGGPHYHTSEGITSTSLLLTAVLVDRPASVGARS